MAVNVARTAEEKLGLALAYLAVEHGSKASWLVEQGVSGRQVRRWTAALVAGDLPRGLVPREGVSMSDTVRLLSEQNQILRDRVTELEQQVEVERSRRVKEVDAMGKAIELLHASFTSNSSGKGSEPDQPRS